MDIVTDGPTCLSGDFDVRSTMEVRNALYELLGSPATATSSVDLTEVRRRST